MSRRASSCLVLAAACCWLPLALGCSDGRPARVRVSGRVLINGEPLHKGYVRFIHDSARASWGEIGQDGRFTLTCFDGQDGAVPGLHHVEVTSNENINESSMRWFAPKKYADYNTSGINIEI
ncbi:MAG: hypothetical protein KDA41_10455, partial [Planctomycetales bacterium]|nr:hypothetical protein [Planctomycetales bacterium]